MSLGLGLGLAVSRVPGGAAAYSPASLFGAGEKGGWWDASVLSSVWEDSAGTVPASVDGVVGKINDLSGNGLHYTQPTTAQKPILRLTSGKYWLDFDGVDDGMVTASVNFTAGDTTAMCVGVRKDTDAAVQCVIEFSDSIVNNAGTFSLFAPSSPAATNVRWSSKGTAQQNAINAAIAAPITIVAMCESDISSDSVSLTINGGAPTTNAADQGTGALGTYPLYLGRRGGANSPLDGQVSIIVLRMAAVSAGEKTSLTTYVNARTGAY